MSEDSMYEIIDLLGEMGFREINKTPAYPEKGAGNRTKRRKFLLDNVYVSVGRIQSSVYEVKDHEAVNLETIRNNDIPLIVDEIERRFGV